MLVKVATGRSRGIHLRAISQKDTYILYTYENKQFKITVASPVTNELKSGVLVVHGKTSHMQYTKELIMIADVIWIP